MIEDETPPTVRSGSESFLHLPKELLSSEKLAPTAVFWIRMDPKLFRRIRIR